MRRVPRDVKMALEGKMFALSAGGVSQAQLAEDIKAAGGVVSNTVHKRVNFLVATPYALEKNTQWVRKARTKFQHVVLVLPEFVAASALAGSLCDPALFSPAAPASSSRESKPPKGATLAEAGLKVGDTIEVLVEMVDEPTIQWWPTTLEAPPASNPLTRAHPIVYLPLPSREYDEPNPSRARFEAACDEPDSTAEPATSGRLYDLEEGEWREWRRMPAAPASAVAALVPAAEPTAVVVSEPTKLAAASWSPVLSKAGASSSTSDTGLPASARHGRRRRPIRWVWRPRFAFKRRVPARAFAMSARRALTRWRYVCGPNACT